MVLKTPETAHDETAWQEFFPRPKTLSITNYIQRLFWNPSWNEALFLVSCAERITEGNNVSHSQQEIVNRIKADLKRRSLAAPYLKFRLVFICRNGDDLQKNVTYLSPIFEGDIKGIGGDIS